MRHQCPPPAGKLGTGFSDGNLRYDDHDFLDQLCATKNNEKIDFLQYQYCIRHSIDTLTYAIFSIPVYGKWVFFDRICANCP